MKRLKLDYEEITPCLKPMTDAWEEMLRTPEGIKIDMDVIHDAVKDGRYNHWLHETFPISLVSINY